MCDNCMRKGDILEMITPDLTDSDDAITRASKRLRCYYECVTRGEDIFDYDDDSDEWDDEDL